MGDVNSKERIVINAFFFFYKAMLYNVKCKGIIGDFNAPDSGSFSINHGLYVCKEGNK
jgi:hypothetical protein